MKKRTRTLGNACAAALLFLSLSSCGGAKSAQKMQAAEVLNLPYHGSPDPHWIYNGPLPSLGDVRMVASLRANTLRVSGLLPTNFSGTLPYYAVPENEGSRTRITVVYPIATGDTASNNTNGRPVRNGPGHYDGIAAFPYNEFGAGGGTPPIEWGGFPFLMYNSERSLAFHGPISYDDGEWVLLRGPVSHGCNRMQGEHVVELAHLLGVDMQRTYSSNEEVDVDVSVDLIDAYDKFQGLYVDVDYPALDEVELPPEDESRVFPTWRAEDFPRFTCEYKPGRALNNTHCNYKPENRLDVATGTVRGSTPGSNTGLGVVECPQGYTLRNVGNQGGTYCSDGTNVWGPFTEAMVEKCVTWGGGRGCRSNRWAQQLALDARGTGLCPLGASFDSESRYCQEGENAFGPFPASLVAECNARGGGSTACSSARWNRNFLLSLLALGD